MAFGDRTPLSLCLNTTKFVFKHNDQFVLSLVYKGHNNIQQCQRVVKPKVAVGEEVLLQSLVVVQERAILVMAHEISDSF